MFCGFFILYWAERQGGGGGEYFLSLIWRWFIDWPGKIMQHICMIFWTFLALITHLKLCAISSCIFLFTCHVSCGFKCITFVNYLYRNTVKSPKKNRRRSRVPDLSAFEDSHDKYTCKVQSDEDPIFLAPRTKNFTLASCKSAERGLPDSCILNLTNKKKYIRINANYTLEMLFTHSILQVFPGHHLVSSQIQSYTLPHSILHLKRKFSQRLSGKTSPDTPQRKLWKNLFLRLISANGLLVMQKESL